MYFIVDFSFNAGKVKVFELGNGYKSNLSALNEVRAANGLPAIKEMIIEELRKKYPTAIHVEAEGDFCLVHNFNSGKKTAFRGNSTIQLIKLIARQVMDEQEHGLTAKHPIIATIHMTNEELVFLESMPAGVKDRIVNFVSSGFHHAVLYKGIFHHFSRKNPIIPSTQLIDLKGNPIEQLQSFMAKFPCAYYVIKPVDATLGKGVCLLEAEGIVQFVESLAEGGFDYEGQKKRGFSSSEDFWNQTRSRAPRFMLIQEFAPSHSITMDDRHDLIATGRVLMRVVTGPGGSRMIESVGGYGYWEAPDKTAKGKLSTDTVITTDYYGARKRVTAAIRPSDYTQITAQLGEHLTPIIDRMASATTDSLIAEMQKDPLMLAFLKSGTPAAEALTPEKTEKDDAVIVARSRASSSSSWKSGFQFFARKSPDSRSSDYAVRVDDYFKELTQRDYDEFGGEDLPVTVSETKEELIEKLKEGPVGKRALEGEGSTIYRGRT